jgi:hypothetical protein
VDFDAEKCHSLLNYKGFPTAFQADDEGSIPFTRSNIFKYLCHGHHLVLTSRLSLILTNVRLPFGPLQLHYSGSRWARRFFAPAAICFIVRLA